MLIRLKCCGQPLKSITGLRSKSCSIFLWNSHRYFIPTKSQVPRSMRINLNTVRQSRGSSMTPNRNASDRDHPSDLSRFTKAQESIYRTALSELRSGQKQTHWMWYIFPQIDGLGRSPNSRYYAIKSIEEARQYLTHPVLGPRLLECAETVLSIEGRSISSIFGYPDDLKLRSCMTLFELAADSESVFARVLDRYFHGERDVRTIQLIDEIKEQGD